MTVERSKGIGLRVTPREFDEIKARAKAAGLSATAYIVAAALGTLGEEPESRLDALERRVAELENVKGPGRRS